MTQYRQYTRWYTRWLLDGTLDHTIDDTLDDTPLPAPCSEWGPGPDVPTLWPSSAKLAGSPTGIYSSVSLLADPSMLMSIDHAARN